MSHHFLSLMIVAALVASGCLAVDDVPTPSADGPATVAPIATPEPRRSGELIVGVPADPLSFLPVAEDEAGQVVGDLLYDPLYRLDSTLMPQPALAAALPSVSADGLVWRIDMQTGATFHGGGPVRAADAAFSLGLAASPSCPFGRELCGAVAARLSRAEVDGSTLVVTLRAAWSPFLAVVLGRLPVLSESAVQAATRAMVGGAAGTDAAGIQELVAAIAEDTNADRCLVALPPTGCRLSDHVDELLDVLTRAGVSPPPPERFAAADTTIDAEAHGEALLHAVAALATVLQSDGVDQAAAALPLVDVGRHPLGGGPFRLESYQPGDVLALARHDGHAPPAAAERVRVRILHDPSAATTALRGGEVDWLVHIEPDQATGLASDPGIAVAAHPDAEVRAIVFNVRPGRIFEDPVARRAFATCFDRAALVADATDGVAQAAAIELAAGSWAAAGAPPIPVADPDGVAAELDAAGWSRGADGIFQRGGVRLSTQIHVRPTRVDLVLFARAAADALRACGIELVVQELDLTGELLLTQLQWPNEFETVLVARPLGVDPDLDLAAFEGSHVTSRDNPGDANPGGYRSATVDRLLGEARTATDQAERARLYAEVAAELAEDPPSVPIWYEPSFAALSSRVLRAGDGAAPDPAQPRYWWDAWAWHLVPP